MQTHAEMEPASQQIESSSPPEPVKDEDPVGYPVEGESISVGVTGHTHEIKDGMLHCAECIAVLTAPEQP